MELMMASVVLPRMASGSHKNGPIASCSARKKIQAVFLLTAELYRLSVLFLREGKGGEAAAGPRSRPTAAAAAATAATTKKMGFYGKLGSAFSKISREAF
jgi:hypothetical protein